MPIEKTAMHKAYRQLKRFGHLDFKRVFMMFGSCTSNVTALALAEERLRVCQTPRPSSLNWTSHWKQVLQCTGSPNSFFLFFFFFFGQNFNTWKEELTYGHIINLMSGKIRSFVKHVEQVGKNMTTLSILMN